MSKNIVSLIIVVVAIVVLGLLVVSGSDKTGRSPAVKKTDTSKSTTTENLTVDKVSPQDRVFGNPNAKTILIEYSDFQCPACAYYGKNIDPVINKYSGDLLFAYRHFPLSYHKNAKPAGNTAEAAGQQNKFFEMAKLLFENQEEWSSLSDPKDKFIEYAKVLNLNTDRFTSDLDDPKLMAKIESDLASGNKLGIDGTPTFYLNGKKLEELKGIEDLDSRIFQLVSLSQNK